MGRWLRIWVDAWRGERVEVRSPLPVEVARERLRTGRMSFVQRSAADGGSTRFLVVGRVGVRRITLRADAGHAQNAWRPVLRGHLEAAGAGSRLTGTLGWHPLTKLLSVVWMAIAGVSLARVVAAAAGEAWAGDATAAGKALLLALIPLGMAAFVIAGMRLGDRAGRAEAVLLRLWLADRIESGSRTPSP